MFGKTVAIRDNMPAGSRMAMQAVLVFNYAAIALCHRGIMSCWVHLHKEIAKPCFILSKGAKSSFTSPLHSILAPNRSGMERSKMANFS